MRKRLPWLPENGLSRSRVSRQCLFVLITCGPRLVNSITTLLPRRYGYEWSLFPCLRSGYHGYEQTHARYALILVNSGLSCIIAPDPILSPTVGPVIIIPDVSAHGMTVRVIYRCDEHAASRGKSRSRSPMIHDFRSRRRDFRCVS